MIKFLARTILAVFSISVFTTTAFAQYSGDHSYANDTQPIEIDGKFEPLGDGLAGDAIEHDRGTLSIRHVDVDIPGNSALPVQFARSYAMHGTAYTGNHLGGWQVEVPFITVRMRMSGYSLYGGNPNFQSTNGCFLLSTDRSGGDQTQLSKYYQGFKMNIPGQGMKPIMEIQTGAETIYPWSSEHGTAATTTDYWKVYCEESGGSYTGAVIAVSPNGDKYEFRTLSVAAAGFEVINVPVTRRDDLEESIEATFHFNMLATRVTDVHGNWVAYDYEREFGYNDQVGTGYPGYYGQYNYESKRLKKIHSNDGRQIDIAYNGPSNPGVTASAFAELVQEGQVTTISSVTAQGSGQDRTWTYEYAQPGSPNYVSVKSIKNLTSVVLPDGRSWDLQLPVQHHRAHRLYNSYDCDVIDDADPTPQPAAMFWFDDIYVKHPSGAKVEFEFELIKNSIATLGPLSVITNSLLCSNPDPEYTISNAVTKKTITAPGAPTATWSFDYDEAAFNEVGLGEVKRRTETRPDGATVERLVLINNEGETVRKTISGTGVNYVEETSYQVITNWDVYGDHADTLSSSRRYKTPRMKRPNEIKTTTEGTTFKTVNSYNTDQGSSFYSYGAPTKVTMTGSGSGSRVIDTAYLRDTDDWILSLPNTITRNNKLFDDFDYDTKGRVTKHKKFGHTVADLTYHTSGDAAGRVNTLKDALGRTYSLSSYKRGIPRSISRPDGKTISRVVSDAGFVTSQTDARSNTTGYEYTALGWLTKIDRPGSWADTSISYTGLGSGITQTSTTGSAQTVTTIDGYHRPTLVKQDDRTGHSSNIYTKTTYDVMGRTKFVSYPSNSSSPTTGMETLYDALNRVTQTKENAVSGAITTTDYQSGHKVVVTNPANDVTTTTYQSYGAPSMGEPIRVVDGIGATTSIVRDAYGNITKLSQPGVERNFTYDSRLRLCRHRAPEFGDELFVYNDANEMTSWSRGETSGSSCSTALTASLTTAYRYDAMGRQDRITFPGGGDIVEKKYDGNGNLEYVKRNGIDWTYSHNELNLLTGETLSVDGRAYPFEYGYTTEGYLTSAKTPESGGSSIQYGPDGFGQPKKLELNGTSYFSNAQYHPNGALKQATLANGHTFSSTLNSRQLIATLKTQKSGTKALDLIYGYEDSMPRVDSIVDGVNSANNRTFEYDANGRLDAAAGPWADTAGFTYDDIGNLEQKAFSYNNGKPNRSVSVAYNASSNLVQSVTKTGMRAEDIAHLSATSTYLYDGLLKRVKSVTGSKTIYSAYSALTGAIGHQDVTEDGQQSGIDYLGFGPLALRLTDGGNSVYTHKDHLGSPVAATDASGTVLWREAYTPFGEKWTRDAANDDRPGYTGHVDDQSTKLTYMQARYYDPSIGRFLRPDPIGYQDQLNLYAYVYSDPVNNIDPTGMVGGCATCFGDMHGSGMSPKSATIAHEGWEPHGVAGGKGAAIGVMMVSPVDESVVAVVVAKKIADGVRAVAATLKGGKAASGLGDLSKAEVGQIQSVVDEAGRPLDVVGSAARGERRNPGSDLPIGKGQGTRSDIDYTTGGANRGNFDGLESGLPDINKADGMLGGTPNAGSPSVRFEPDVPPRKIDEN